MQFVAEKLCVDALLCASTIHTVRKNIANFALVLANFAFKFYSNSKTKADFGSKVISEAKSNVFPEITSFPDL